MGFFNSVIHFYNNQKGAVKIVMISVLCLIIWMLSGAIFHKSKKNQALAQKEISFSIIESNASAKNRVLKFTGVGRAKKKVSIVCEVAGEIEEIVAVNGQFLKKGEAILKVDPINKKETLEGLQSKLHQYEIELKSVSSLYNKRLSSESDLAKAKAQVSNAKADLKKAEIDLDNTIVKAPFDGYIDNISVKEHDYLFGVSFPGNETVGTFISSEPTVIRAEIPDSQMKFIKVGLTVKIDDIDGNQMDGKISYISKIINDASSAFPIEISFSNSDFKILDGQVVSISINSKKEQAHKLPQSVLDLDSNGNIGIKAVDDSGLVHFYKTDIIDEDNSYIWVTGCPEKLKVISLGHPYIKIGDRLKI